MAEYEFSADENQKLLSLVSQMQRFAVTTVVAAILILLYAISVANSEPDIDLFSITTLATIADSVVVLVLGVIWLQPAQEFKKISKFRFTSIRIYLNLT